MKALISGVTGQDGSYLLEFLINKGYEVHGIIRRASTFNLERLYNVKSSNVNLHFADLSVGTHLLNIINEIHPDEIYNLAAQSHVRISFDIPEYTSDITGLGCLRFLEAIHKSKTHPRFYQASSSEMYGTTLPPQSETSPFDPNSPYACSKLYAYNMTRNYRRAYNLHASNGILYNHESCIAGLPFFMRTNKGFVDILPIRDIVSLVSSVKEDRNIKQTDLIPLHIHIWDGSDWTRIKSVTVYPNKDIVNQLDIKSNNSAGFKIGNSGSILDNKVKKIKLVNARGGTYTVTGEHKCILEDGVSTNAENLIGRKFFTTRSKRINNMIGSWLKFGSYPIIKALDFGITENEAMFAGYLCGDGSIDDNGNICLKSFDIDTLKKYSSMIYAGVGWGPSKEKDWINARTISIVNMNPNMEWRGKFRKSDFFCNNGDRRVPWKILNSNNKIKMAFLHGYYEADGLQGGLDRLNEFKNIKSSSMTLTAGMVYLINTVVGQEYNINVDIAKWKGKETYYYSVNFLSTSKTYQNRRNLKAKYDAVKLMIDQQSRNAEITRKTGATSPFIRKIRGGYIPKFEHHFYQKRNEVKRVITYPVYDGYLYDLETDSGKYMCGIGVGVVHNSPRRGINFVTRKITQAATRIKLGLQDKLILGNLDAKRDWGYAGDFVEAMWLILQQDNPDDYVIATGESHTVREFVEETFRVLDLDYDKYISIDKRLFRPSEVDNLCGDASKAKRVLGWEPKVKFKELIKMMVASDMILARQEKLLRDNGLYIENHYGGE